MNLRHFAILLILFPALRGVGFLGEQPASDSHSSCCELVEMVSCCGEVSYEEVCSQASAQCECVTVPADLPTPSPAPLLPSSIGDLILEIPDPTEQITVELSEEGSSTTAIALELIQSDPTHNQVQAVLGVWRI